MPLSPNQDFQAPPCVGRCSTVYGDAVCRGCKRFVHEVTHWNQYTEKQKESVWRRLESLISQVLPRWVTIESVKHLNERGIRYPKHLSPYAWALVCIETFEFDLRLLPVQAGLRINANLYQEYHQNKEAYLLAIQNDLYQISCAYHQRQTQCLAAVSPS